MWHETDIVLDSVNKNFSINLHYEMFRHKEKLKEFYSDYPFINHLDFALNILLLLFYNIFNYLSIHLSIHQYIYILRCISFFLLR